MEPDTIAFVALVFIWVGFVLETVVRFRQQMLFRQSTRPPKELESFLDDTFFQTRAFAEDSLNIEAAEDLFHQVLGFFRYSILIVPPGLAASPIFLIEMKL